MQIDLTSPDVVKTFGNNLDTCLRLIGSRPESLALRCNTSPHVILGFKEGLGILSEQLLSAVCTDIGISRELILKEHRSPAEAIRQLENAFRAKGKITSSNLIGTDKTRGEEVMKPQIELPPGKLNDHAWRQNFGRNVQVCLQHMGKTAMSLAIRIEMSESQVEQIFVGKLSLSNDDIEAIRLESGLNTNDLIMDYMDNGRRNDELLAKLKVAGRIKPPQPAAEAAPEPARSLEPEVPVPAIEAEMTQEEPAIEPAIPASTTSAEEPETMGMKTMTNATSESNIWDDNDIIATIGGRTFNLRNKEQRKLIGNNIRSLKEQCYDEDTWNEFFARVNTNRDVVWLNGVRVGTSAITGTDVKTFAEFFGVSVLSLLTGEFKTAEAATVKHDLVWSKDGMVATDTASGHVFDLSDGQLSCEVARRVCLLCPAETTIEQMLDKCCIDETTAWFEAVQNGTRNLAEDYIEALAEFLDVTDFALLSGEGLDLPEEVADEGDSAEEAGASEPVAPTVEPALQQPEAADSAEEAPSADGTDSEQLLLNLLDENAQRLAAFQEHFKLRLLSADFHLADDVSPRSFLAATQATEVDWCSVYYTMTEDGVETLKQVTTIAERFNAGDDALNMDIFTHVLSMALKQR